METRMKCAACDALAARLAEAERDAARLNHLEGMTRFYGDGYTEPREWSVGIDWQQTRLDEGIPSLRDVIDAAMRETER